MTVVLLFLKFTVIESVVLALACSAFQLMFRMPSVGRTSR